MRKSVLMALSLLMLAAPAYAQMPPGGPGGGPGGQEPRDHEPGPRHERPSLPDFKFPGWRDGRWHHGRHEGVDGWWWIVGGVWYFYTAPVYPYPDLYTPPAVVVEGPAASGSFAYYCTAPSGYYPYVTRCASGWQKVVRAVETAPAVVPETPSADARTLDDRQLNAYGTEFASIDPHSAGARSRLKNLGERVKLFKKSLYGRSYNAMDILRDTDDLLDRINDARAGAK